MFDSFVTSWQELNRHFIFRRLVTEDDGVKGPGWSQWSTTPGHTLINTCRIALIIIFSPIWASIPNDAYNFSFQNVKKNWLIDVIHTPPAALSKPCDGGRPTYDTPHSQPKWMVEISFKHGAATTRQIPWALSQDQYVAGKTNGYLYNAISYSLESAEETFQMRNGYLPAPDGPPNSSRKYSLPTRLMISRIVLDEYIELRKRASWKDRFEYVWFDECCISDESLHPDDPKVANQRSDELGRLADIFSGASSVVVFCHIAGCHHTDLRCPWGKRLFTLPEIYYAKTIDVMILSLASGNFDIIPRQGRDFKHDMQREATLGTKSKQNWHLSSVMEHATQSASASWQLSIHYLIVEAIRRDLAGGFEDHQYLGRSLNGLLPRRSVLGQFSGDGWMDLSWMLELNQGYYNAAALAAVCSLAEHDSLAQSWLGKPISPGVGNERLEPLVTAFPVPTGLNFLNPRVVKLNHYLERDPDGLTNNSAMRGLRIATISILVIWSIITTIIFGTTLNFASIVFGWPGFAQFALAYLIAGSMYVKREGWCVIDESLLGLVPNVTAEKLPMTNRGAVDPVSLSNWLRERDSQLGKLKIWGRDQLAPEWESPNPKKRPSRPAMLVDMQHGTCAETILLNQDSQDENPRRQLKVPDYLITLAVHGCGITCMLLDSYQDPLVASEALSKKLEHMLFLTDPVARKMGMVNLPPHVLTEGHLVGALRVGENDEYVPASTPRSSLSDLGSKV